MNSNPDAPPTNNTPAPLAISMGDPAGVGPIITAAAWHTLNTSADHAFYVIAPPDLYAGQVPVQKISDPAEAPDAFSHALPVLPLSADMPIPTPGHAAPETAPAIIASIETATRHALAGRASAVVTNPIAKALLYGQGFAFPGHTEFLAELCGPHTPTGKAPAPVMLLVGGGLRVALATIHLPLRDAIDAITVGGLIATAQTVHEAMLRDFGIEDPRLAFTGLNPHAGEQGTLGTEEQTIINPAAETLRAEGISISDARPGDTVFAEALAGSYDAVIAMTHDQGLIPVKTLDLWNGVNTTLGLPIIRTSPDHGTGYDAAEAGSARPDSLIAAIRLASAVAIHRAKASAPHPNQPAGTR